MKKIVIGLSGGMDSATLLGVLLNEGYEVHCCTFYYGSKHGKWENRAAEDLIDYYLLDKKQPVFGHPIDLSLAFKGFNSSLLQTGEAIPEGHYNDENMRRTVVPGRNLIFASIMAGLAESIGADLIGLGVHAGDHHIYPDCRPDFLSLLRETIIKSSDGKVGLYVPFMNKSKTDILQKGLALPIQVPYQLTRTCYKDQEVACGKCGSCCERLESFKNLNITDPIKYE
jgi:7-cyano-7-deazaguanine synthase